MYLWRANWRAHIGMGTNGWVCVLGHVVLQHSSPRLVRVLHWSWVTHVMLRRNAALSWTLYTAPQSSISWTLRAALSCQWRCSPSPLLPPQPGRYESQTRPAADGRTASVLLDLQVFTSSYTHLSQACILDQVRWQVEAHGQGLQL